MPTNDNSKKSSLKKTLVAGVVAGVMATGAVAPAAAVAVENNGSFLPTPSFSQVAKDYGADSLLDFSLFNVGEAILPTEEEIEGFNEEGGGGTGPIGGNGGGRGTQQQQAQPAPEPEAEIEDPEEPLAEEPGFADVHSGQWFYDAVNFVTENGIMIGVSPTQFAPNASFTRAMAATVLFRMAGANANFSATFTDVGPGQWYSAAITWAAQNDIVLGIGGDLFDPYASITREQLAVMLFRFATFMGYDMTTSELSGFADVGGVSDWATEAMSWAVHHGIIQGANNNLNPQGTATRAEVATMLQRVMTLFD